MSMKPFKLSKTDRSVLRDVIQVAEADNFPALIGHSGYRFVRICRRNVSVYRCKQLGIILKRFNFILMPTTPLRVRVPTINIDGEWVAQPIVKRIKTKIAVTLIRKQIGEMQCDLHTGNVGWLNGKPLMFDW